MSQLSATDYICQKRNDEGVKYIRASKKKDLPSSEIYEADDEDLKFIEAFNKK